MAVSLASTNGLLNEVAPVRHPSVALEDVNYGRTVSSQPEMDGTGGVSRPRDVVMTSYQSRLKDRSEYSRTISTFDGTSAQGAVCASPNLRKAVGVKRNRTNCAGLNAAPYSTDIGETLTWQQHSQQD